MHPDLSLKNQITMEFLAKQLPLSKASHNSYCKPTLSLLSFEPQTTFNAHKKQSSPFGYKQKTEKTPIATYIFSTTLLSHVKRTHSAAPTAAWAFHSTQGLLHEPLWFIFVRSTYPFRSINNLLITNFLPTRTSRAVPFEQSNHAN